MCVSIHICIILALDVVKVKNQSLLCFLLLFQRFLNNGSINRIISKYRKIHIKSDSLIISILKNVAILLLQSIRLEYAKMLRNST